MLKDTHIEWKKLFKLKRDLNLWVLNRRRNGQVKECDIFESTLIYKTDIG